MDAPWPGEPPPAGDPHAGPPPWPPAPSAVPPIVRGSAANHQAVTGRPSGGYPAVDARPSGRYGAAPPRPPSATGPVITPARQTGRHAQRPTGSFGLPASSAPAGAYGTAAASAAPAPSTGHLRAVSGLPAEGDDLGGYRLLKTIGRGSMGRVYRARDPMGRDVALKLILAEQADAEGMQRFTREGQAMAAVPRHGNVVNVHSTGTARGLPYLVLDLVEGESLADVLKRGRLRVVDAVGMTLKLARAVQHVHAAGVLHRDLKPANILIRGDDGEPVLSDFGMAGLRGADRLTRTGDLVGTPLYMPPEQVLGMVRRVDARSDVWALGAMLYEMLSGAPPFTGRTLVDVSRAITTNEPAAIEGVDPGLMGIVRRALAKRQEDRFQTAGALADALAAWGAGRAPPPPPPPPRRGRLVLVLGALACAGGLAGAAALVHAARARAGQQQAAARPSAGTAPTPVEAPSAPAPSLGPFARLVEQVRGGRALEAMGWLNQQRELRRTEVGEAAGNAEAAVRELVPARVLASSRDDLVAALGIVRRLRELAGVAPARDAVADAVLSVAADDLQALIDPPDGPGARDPEAGVRLVEAVAEAGLLPRTALLAERVVDAGMVAYVPGRLPQPCYHRLLLAMVRLDVDLQRDHVVRLALVPPQVGRGPIAEYVNLRIKGEDHLRDDDDRREIATALLELVRKDAATFGPVTRARALWLGARAASSREQAFALLDEAASLDPRTPFPHFQRAGLLLQDKRHADAAQSAEAALERLERDGYGARPSVAAYETFLIYRTAANAFTAARALDRARDVIERVAGLSPNHEDLPGLREALRAAEAAGAGRGDF